jgi:hypothetical protein
VTVAERSARRATRPPTVSARRQRLQIIDLVRERRRPAKYASLKGDVDVGDDPEPEPEALRGVAPGKA